MAWEYHGRKVALNELSTCLPWAVRDFVRKVTKWLGNTDIKGNFNNNMKHIK